MSGVNWLIVDSSIAEQCPATIFLFADRGRIPLANHDGDQRGRPCQPRQTKLTSRWEDSRGSTRPDSGPAWERMCPRISRDRERSFLPHRGLGFGFDAALPQHRRARDRGRADDKVKRRVGQCGYLVERCRVAICGCRKVERIFETMRWPSSRASGDTLRPDPASAFSAARASERRPFARSHRTRSRRIPVDVAVARRSRATF
jgi:hypothetical protein